MPKRRVNWQFKISWTVKEKPVSKQRIPISKQGIPVSKQRIPVFNQEQRNKKHKDFYSGSALLAYSTTLTHQGFSIHYVKLLLKGGITLYNLFYYKRKYNPLQDSSILRGSMTLTHTLLFEEEV